MNSYISMSELSYIPMLAFTTSLELVFFVRNTKEGTPSSTTLKLEINLIEICQILWQEEKDRQLL